jgi:hypothetical protein
MKKLLLFIFILISFVCCKKDCEDVDGNLTPAERSWFSYSGGEILIFKSNLNLIDTCHVGSENSQYNLGYQQKEDACEHHQQMVSYKIDNSHFYFLLSVSHHNEWNPSGTAAINVQYRNFIFTDFTPQNNVLINGILYNNVYIMTTDTNGFSSQAVWRIYYTKLKGILKYDLTQGEQWVKIN